MRLAGHGRTIGAPPLRRRSGTVAERALSPALAALLLRKLLGCLDGQQVNAYHPATSFTTESSPSIPYTWDLPMRICVINPFAGTEQFGRENLEAIAAPGTEFDICDISDRYPLNNNQWLYFKHGCTGPTIDRAIEAERQGYNAVFISCNVQQTVCPSPGPRRQGHRATGTRAQLPDPQHRTLTVLIRRTEHHSVEVITACSIPSREETCCVLAVDSAIHLPADSRAARRTPPPGTSEC